ncbi:MAG: hypothetical protein GX275_07420 [Clostridiales bacterium]|nr:hypothetical protein [Clostridiales bacterium]
MKRESILKDSPDYEDYTENYEKIKCCCNKGKGCKSNSSKITLVKEDK